MDTIIWKLRQVNYKQVLLWYSLMWCAVYVIFRLSFSGEGTFDVKLACYNVLVPAFLSFVVGTLVNFHAQGKSHIPFRRMLLSVIILVVIDQGIKLAVKEYQGPDIPIIDNWLFFSVYLHTQSSWADKIGIIPPLWVHVLLVLMIVSIYRNFRYRKGNMYFVAAFTIFLSASFISVVADNLFYGGSYNYIEYARFGIFDLKDVYALTGICVMLQTTFDPKLKGEKKSFLEYLRYELNNIRHLVSRVRRK
jgi:signal peptidase II